MTQEWMESKRVVLLHLLYTDFVQPTSSQTEPEPKPMLGKTLNLPFRMRHVTRAPGEDRVLALVLAEPGPGSTITWYHHLVDPGSHCAGLPPVGPLSPGPRTGGA